MEGLADHFLRDIITEVGGYDLAISEFIRVTDHLLPPSVFFKRSPELHKGGNTPFGTPVRIQLLGSDPAAMAENACRAIELGSHGVDINFGCPSKTVNNSNGGAALLKEPETLYRVVNAIRDATPLSAVVSAKMRLGFNDTSLMWECAHAISDGGANELTVHARTREQGYTPPAYWDKVCDFEKRLGIPIIINGEIWTLQDAKKALIESKSSHIMLGRGAIQNPWLALSCKTNKEECDNWAKIAPLLEIFWTRITLQMNERYCAGRLKQWLNYLKKSHPEAQKLFDEIRGFREVEQITRILKTN